MKRFYKTVSVSPHDQGGHVILLDNRVVKTSGGNPLILPTKSLADLVMSEWACQAEEINVETMPLTQLAGTAIDTHDESRKTIALDCIAYADTDLLCYRTDTPAKAGERQKALWDPVLETVQKRHGVPVKTTTILQVISQDAALKKILTDFIQSQDIWRFTMLQVLTALSGSLYLALVFLNADIDEEGFSVVAPINTIVPSSTTGKKASC